MTSNGIQQAIESYTAQKERLTSQLAQAQQSCTALQSALDNVEDILYDLTEIEAAL